MKAILRDGLKALGFAPSKALLDAFGTYASELRRWSRAYSLTSLKTDSDIAIKHFLDSCLYLVALEGTSGVLPKKGRRPLSLADVGSGAGFPGIPIKLLRPDFEVHLIEPSRKKSAFLRHMIRTLSLEGITVIEKPVEEVGDVVVDVAVTRALFKAGDFVKKAGRLVGAGGLFILSKGPRVGEELRGTALDYELKVLPLPGSDAMRHFVVIRKGGLRTPLKSAGMSVCANSECRLRRAGCRGFEACPGFKGKGP